MVDRPSRLAAKQAKLSGPAMIGMIVTLESFLITLAASEAKTRPDPVAFLKALRAGTVEGANRFGHQETVTAAEEYADDMIAEIVRESGVDMGGQK